MASPNTLKLRRSDPRLSERYVRCPYVPELEGLTVQEVVDKRKKGKSDG